MSRVSELVVLLPLLATLGAWLGACANGSTDALGVGSGQACETTFQCPAGDACVDGQCAKLCVADSYCPNKDQQCAGGICRVNDNPECRADEQCTDATSCQDVAGAYCEGGSCHYHPKADRTACDRAETPVGSLLGLCARGECVECLAAGDCTNFPGLYPLCFSATCNWGVCGYVALPDQVCVDAYCEDGFAFARRTCGALGLCPQATQPGASCGGYACAVDAQSCRTSCTEKSHCAGGLLCMSDSVCDTPRGSGLSCSLDAECVSQHCVCTGLSCAARACAPNACACQYDADSNGVCDGNLSDGSADAPACVSPQLCIAGACSKAAGTSCSLDAECASKHCVCTGPSCAARACAPNACACQYDAYSNGVCDGNLNDSTEDAPGCVSPQFCVAGACTKVSGASCSLDAECVSQHCVCTGLSCAARACAPNACACQYDADSNGACDGNLNDGTEDAPGCVGLQVCVAGACTVCGDGHCAGREVGALCKSDCCAEDPPPEVIATCARCPWSGVCCGDVDQDGVVTSADATAVSAAAIGNPSACTSAICDVNSDGQVDVVDVVAVLRLANGLPQTINCPARQ